MRVWKKLLLGALALLLLGATAVALWPSSRPQAGYPFARRMAGSRASPLWRTAPSKLDRASADDVMRLEQAARRLERALADARRARSLLSTERPEELGAQGRLRVRAIWWSFVEPIIALDAIKHRYEGWYGIDYTAHRELHARAFALTFAALCAQVAAGHQIVDLVVGSRRVQALFDEAMPEYGLPSGTFRALRTRLARTRDYSFVPAGAQWYDAWMARTLRRSSSAAVRRLASLVGDRRRAAMSALDVTHASRVVENKAELLSSQAFVEWFPVQREFAEWAGDTRVAPEGRRLIGDAQIEQLRTKLRPGDVIVERRNWYVSNIGLPGFWPHAALFTGSQADIRAAFDGDPALRARYGGAFSAYLARAHPAAWRALGERDDHGHPHQVVEAVSEGVTAASLIHSCGADYVAALRPRLPSAELARAIDRALAFFGRPYDFNFDFATDDALVCSELVMKAYEPVAGATGARGLTVPYITVAGRRAIPPTEIVRVFANERGRADAQLDFVWFLDGREGQHRAVVAGADALASSVSRPKWDIAQP